MSVTGSASRQLTPLEPLVEGIESAAVLDEPAQTVGKLVRGNLSGGLKDAVSGTWLGHALHPMLTDVVVGSFLSATLLDLFGGDGFAEASQRLVQVGIAAYGPTALSGVSDWADAEPVDDGVRRSGLVHAASNSVALALYASSLRARRRGARGRAALLSTMGASVLGFAGYLGGHLSFSRGVGPDQTVFDPGPSEWTQVPDAGGLSEGQPQRLVIDDTPILMLRRAGELFAIHDRCSHRGCSLSDGEIEGQEVVCGCHGSRFDLRNGALRGGPATAGQPAFEVRERDGQVEIKRLD